MGGPEETRALKLRRALAEEMFAHARACAPEECCGLLGGVGREVASVYPLTNVAREPSRTYEAAPRELFGAQRLMRERGETLLSIYHSHPRSRDPEPSPTDVRLAFYPAAVYFIIGFDEQRECVLRAFRVYEREGRWERAEFLLTD
ncbi:MAG TPA: M67 family metallopeptidase [Pyrinomonadaceae bacterium]|nr:M67 family metallopeptidase [Pyrinomonadaceae bacterium]